MLFSSDALYEIGLTALLFTAFLSPVSNEHVFY